MKIMPHPVIILSCSGLGTTIDLALPYFEHSSLTSSMISWYSSSIVSYNELLESNIIHRQKVLQNEDICWCLDGSIPQLKRLEVCSLNIAVANFEAAQRVNYLL
jgi:hypothetical protein